MPANNSSPLVSIIMPTYNRATLILDTIESVRMQTYLNWELVIVDDSSTDNSSALINGVNDNRIRLINTASRIGITPTREEGLKQSTGELVAFMDSDDLWDPAKIEKQVLAMNRFPEAGFCLTGGYNFRELNKPVEFFYKQRDGWKYDDLLIPFFKSEVAATTPSLLFRKKAVESIGFASHVEFILRLAARFKGIILYEPLLFRRLHESNTNAEDWRRGERDGLRLIRTYRPLLPRAVSRNAFFQFYINSGEKYLKNKQRKKAIENFLKAWSFRPLSIVPLKKTAKAFYYFLCGK